VWGLAWQIVSVSRAAKRRNVVGVVNRVTFVDS